MFIVFRDVLMVEQVLLSPQMKRKVIIDNNLVYTSCRMTYGLGSQEIRKKKLLPPAQSSSRHKNFFSTSKYRLKNGNRTFTGMRYFT